MGNISEDLRGIYEFKSDFFDVGQFVITKGVRNLIGTKYNEAEFVFGSIVRYCRKDWGDLSEKDALINEEEIARNNGNMSLFACYQSEYGKIYISTNRISEAGEYATTVFLPGER